MIYTRDCVYMETRSLWGKAKAATQSPGSSCCQGWKDVCVLNVLVTTLASKRGVWESIAQLTQTPGGQCGDYKFNSPFILGSGMILGIMLLPLPSPIPLKGQSQGFPGWDIGFMGSWLRLKDSGLLSHLVNLYSRDRIRCVLPSKSTLQFASHFLTAQYYPLPPKK